MTTQENKYVHFIDYENVHMHVPMNKIAKGKNQQVILFVGNLQTIPNEWLRIDYNVTTIRVKQTGKDNLDFHLAVYLGMIHVARPMEVQFIIWSGDSGFDDLIEHLKERGRRIERKDPRPHPKKKASVKKTHVHKESAKKAPVKKESGKKAQVKADSTKKSSPPQNKLTPSIQMVGERVIEILTKTPAQVRPRKKGTLANQIEAWRSGIGFTHTPSNIVHWLIQKEHIVIDNNERIKYNL
jgi:hypothetical protein